MINEANMIGMWEAHIAAEKERIAAVETSLDQHKQKLAHLQTKLELEKTRQELRQTMEELEQARRELETAKIALARESSPSFLTSAKRPARAKKKTTRS